MGDRAGVISREPLTPALVAELRSMMLANRDAVPGYAPLDPNWSELSRLDRGDAMAVVVARVDGLAVGYVAHIASRQHLTGEVWAMCAALFVDPCFGEMAWRMVRHSEDLARLAGAVVVAYNVPPDSPAARFLEAMRYTTAEVVLQRRLTH